MPSSLITDDTTTRDKELTHGQTQIWVGQQLHPSSPLYNMAFAWVFAADLDVDRFRSAWRRVVDDSEVLRARITESDGTARQSVRELGSCVTEVLDRRDDSLVDFRRWCRERCARPLDPQVGLVDSVLVKLADGRTGWYLNQHHLITDAWSTVLLFRRVAEAYAGSEDPIPREPSPRPSPGGRRPPRASEAAQDHWKARLERSGSTIPFYGRDGEPTGTASTRLTLELDEARTRALARLGGEPGFLSLSPEMSRLALFATLLLSWLHRVSGRSDLGFDAPVAGRPTPEDKRALGLFIEMFPFVVSLDPGETFRTLGGKCLAEAGLLLRHALPGTSAPSGAVAGNVVLNYFPESFGDFAGIPAEVEWVHPGHGDSVHALRLQVHDFAGTGCWTLHFDFNEQVLPERLRQRSVRHFEKLLDAVLDDPDRPIARVDLLTRDERQMVQRFDARESGHLPRRTVMARFLERADAEPEKVALREGDEVVTFGALRVEVEALAASLVTQGVGPGDRVAILYPRSIHAVVAILATMRAGAAYVPVDPAYPQWRQEHIIGDAGCRLVLGASESRGSRPSLQSVATSGLGVLEEARPALGDLAYVLFTSGSTGHPKGVQIEHGGLIDYLEWAEREYVRGERMRFALFTSLSFDLTVTSLFLPLITGGELVIYPPSQGPVDAALMDVVRDNAVDFVKLTPSHLSLMRQMDLKDSNLRRVVVGGEDFRTELSAAISAGLRAQVEITNEYGPTEAVVGCIAHRFDPQTDTDLRVPIGRPADHVEAEILEGAGLWVPEGMPGELWVSRFGLARGYQGRPGLTADRFRPHPRRSGERRYRTGDLVRMVDPTTMEYLGRRDRQLKIAGHRVEPGEIEAALESLAGVDQGVVIARKRSAPQVPTDDEIRYCARCGLPSNHPRATLDRDDVCRVCRSYETLEEHAQGYFGNLDDLRGIFEASRRAHGGRGYDCMMLLSGGKDSTYALCQLAEMGLSIYAFTLDNGYISEGAKDNIRRVTEELGVTVEFGTTPAMNAIFRDSLQRFANVCQGCFKTIYTLSTQRAHDLGIPIIVTGLSRGQMFETRLTEEMFRDGHRSPEEVDAAVLAARKVYHRTEDEVSRSLDVSLFRDDRLFEEIRYVDFYRYHDVDLDEMLAYLRRKVPWVRPGDTGRSTNCLINDVGISVHKQRMGFHNYALPYSWDVRMGHKTRDEALDELDDDIDPGYVRRTLVEIGCDPEEVTASADRPVLSAFYVASEDVTEDAIRRRLAERLPSAVIPSHLQRIDAVPLTAHGKVDTDALPHIELGQHAEADYRPPDGPVEEYLADLWREQLGADRVGADDSFFELGGTSLAAMEVMIRLCREFDLDLPLETLFAHPTLGALARVAEDQILADVAELDDADLDDADLAL